MYLKLRELQINSRLSFLRARYYDAGQGRFISRDPFPGYLSQPSTLNAYPYALNNPATLTDPSGENPFVAAALLGGTISGGINIAAQLITMQPQRSEERRVGKECRSRW